MKSELFILAFFVGVINCSCQNKNSIKNESYEIPDSLFSFFPNENVKDNDYALSFFVENAKKMEYPYIPEEFEITYIVKGYCFKTNLIKNTALQYFSHNTLKKFTADSDNFFLIGSERELLNQYDSITLKSKFVENQELIPNFHELVQNEKNIYNSHTLCGLSNEYKIWLLKSGNNYVLPKEYKYEWSLLPEKIKHGYRSGLAFTENDLCIIYWVVVW